jgi:hypothetical protein
MSLRGFHIVFITVATLLFGFLVAWGFLLAPAEAGAIGRILGVVGVIGLLGLPLYGVYFYRKAKKLIL